jgi:transcriptional regulator with XRE-family HTH domain
MDASSLKKLDRLRRAVAHRRVTQTEISAATGVNQSQISRILAGPNKRLSENVQKLCDFADSLAEVVPPREKLDQEAFLLLAAMLEGSPKVKKGVVDVLRHMLALKRQCERPA